MTAFTASRKAIATALDGKMPEEAMLRAAKSELDQAEAVVVTVVDPTQVEGRVTAEEALRVLQGLFLVMENSLIQMRRQAKKDLLITNEAADVFIAAKDILKRGGCERIANRRHEPITLSHTTPK